MLCNVIHAVVFFSISFSYVTILSQCLMSVETALPPGVEDEIILIEHLPGYRVHLQDFFWTGEENGPRWESSDHKMTLIETKTIFHTSTVYVYDHDHPTNDSLFTTESEPVSEMSTCPMCIDPTPTLEEVDQNIGVFFGDDPGPRYWLLTVLRAGEKLPSNVELRLARLYRTAFNRQQHRHLGLPDLYGRRLRLRRALIRQINKNRKRRKVGDVEVFDPASASSLPIQMQFIDIPKDEISLIVNPESLETQIKPFEERQEDENSPGDVDIDETLFDTENSNSSQSKVASDKTLVNPNLVQVSMQNVTVIEDVGTRLIYSVHLGGKPVPAETAAKDMALLSPQEVALELGTPVIIQSEPFLRETTPLALSRKRDAWVFVAAAAAAILMLAVVTVTLAIVAKRKKANSVVLPPPMQGILKRDKETSAATLGIDNTLYTSETEARTDGTSRRTPMSYSRTPITLGTPDTLEDGIKDISSDDEIKKKEPMPWEMRHYPEIARNIRRKRMNRRKTLEYPKTSDSTDSNEPIPTLDSLEKEYNHEEEAPGSPHSYLSMPSCKDFPDMTCVEPLCRVLEPVKVKHLDLEEHELPNGDRRKSEDYFLMRSASEMQDPGVVNPIVWDSHRNIIDALYKPRRSTKIDPALESQNRVSFESTRVKKRLHEFLEDSFSLFNNKEEKNLAATRFTMQGTSNSLANHVYNKGILAVKGSTDFTTDKSWRPRTLTLRQTDVARTIEETGNVTGQPRAWAVRPMSAGPFHRPCIPARNTQMQNNDGFKSASKDPLVTIPTICKQAEQFNID